MHFSKSHASEYAHKIASWLCGKKAHNNVAKKTTLESPLEITQKHAVEKRIRYRHPQLGQSHRYKITALTKEYHQIGMNGGLDEFDINLCSFLHHGMHTDVCQN